MSFTRQAKEEVCAQAPENICCKKAFLSGLIRSCGELNIKNKQYELELNTELKSLCQVAETTVKQIYGQDVDITLLKEERPNKNEKYVIRFQKDFTDKILADTFVMKFNEGGARELINGISRHITQNECCIKDYIKGIFLGCASANIVIKDINNLKKHTGGYHLEFVFNNTTLAKDFSHLLSAISIRSKVLRRKNLTVVYIKEAEHVSDILACVGAHNAVLTLQNEFAVREVRNKLNRQLNCLNANMNKTVKASLSQLNDIKYIDEKVGIGALPENLYELCMLRLANPDETLESLAALMTTPLTKSGINHRMRKISAIAAKLKKENK